MPTIKAVVLKDAVMYINMNNVTHVMRFFPDTKMPSEVHFVGEKILPVTFTQAGQLLAGGEHQEDIETLSEKWEDEND